MERRAGVLYRNNEQFKTFYEAFVVELYIKLELILYAQLYYAYILIINITLIL
jgi:hypothetical protein